MARARERWKELEKETKIEAFIDNISTGVPVSSDDVFEVSAMRHIDSLELPMKAEVITRYENEVFNKKPYEQHLNFRRLTLSKEVLGNSFKTFMDGDRKFDGQEAPLARVAIFCELMRLCVPECGSVLHLKVTVGSKDEVPIPEEALKLWEILVLNPRLKAGEKTQIPKNKKKLIQSLVKTTKDLFGEVFFMPVDYTQPQKDGKKTSETCYTVNPEWVERQMELFRYSSFCTETSERDT